MGSSVIVYQDAEAVRKDLEAMAPVLSDVLPSAVEQQRFVRVVAKAIIENPKLMECTRASLVAAIHEAAQLGLEPTGLLGSAYLVPYRVKVRLPNGREGYAMEAKLIPGYRGLIDLARRSGEVEAVEAKVVRARDHFVLVEGSGARVEHERFIPDPRLAPEERDPGPIVGAYMKATLRGGVEQYEWMTYDDIEAVRKRSRAADQGAWVSDYSEMARKTVVRRGSKYLPLTTEFRRALELDEEAERAAVPPAIEVREPSKATQMLLARGASRSARKAGTATDTASSDSEALRPSESVSEDSGDQEQEDGEVGPCEVEGCDRYEGHDGDHVLSDAAHEA